MHVIRLLQLFSVTSVGDTETFLDPGGGSQKATLVVVVHLVVVISSLKIPKAFLVCSGAQ